MTRASWLCAAAVAAALAPGAVTAQPYSVQYGFVGAPMSSFLSTSYLTQRVVNDLSTPRGAKAALDDAGRGAGKPRAALTVPTGGPATMPAKLAAHYPADRRAQAKTLFDELLVRYRDIERRFGIPPGDLGGALAAFVVGSWLGLHDAPFPDERFPPVVLQMRALLASRPDIAQAPLADRREMYEQMAILGMLMAGTRMALQQRPDAAAEQRLREAARAYLRRFFGDDAERVGFGPEGLRIE